MIEITLGPIGVTLMIQSGIRTEDNANIAYITYVCHVYFILYKSFL